MKGWPITTNQLRADGWEYTNDSNCRGCGARMEWWISPGGKKTPMAIVPPKDPLFSNEEHRQPHFIDCPNVGDFRK